MFDRGPYVSFANCGGLPYHVGDVIKKEEHLLVATPELFRQRFNIEVRLRSEVVRIDREQRLIEVNDLEQGTIYNEHYDALVLSPGAHAIRPDLPGIDLPGIFSLRTIPDSRRSVSGSISTKPNRPWWWAAATSAWRWWKTCIKGHWVTVVEKQSQVMPLLDPEMAAPIHEMPDRHGVNLCLNESVVRFDPGKGHRSG
jgi:NADPH-dependent 2,4-dienoyl-CoA reductase/sulfur reductase-like enzyme